MNHCMLISQITGGKKQLISQSEANMVKQMLMTSSQQDSQIHDVVSAMLLCLSGYFLFYFDSAVLRLVFHVICDAFMYSLVFLGFIFLCFLDACSFSFHDSVMD